MTLGDQRVALLDALAHVLLVQATGELQQVVGVGVDPSASDAGVGYDLRRTGAVGGGAAGLGVDAAGAGAAAAAARCSSLMRGSLAMRR